MRFAFVSVWFQLLWFLAVIGQQQTQWWLLFAVVCTYAYEWKRYSPPLRQWFAISAVGIAMDYCNLKAQLFDFSNDFLPVWLMCLWFLFAWYAYNLIPIVKRIPFAVLMPIGGGLGAASYLAGAQLGAVVLPYSLSLSFGVLFIEWSLIMLLIIKVVFRDNPRIR